MTARRIQPLLVIGLFSGLAALAASPAEQLAAAEPAPSVESDCVTVAAPSPSITYTYRYTDLSGSVSTLMRQWLESTNTSSRLRLTHTHAAQGTTASVTTGKHRIVDDLVIVETYETAGTNPAGAFSTRITHAPGLVDGPGFRVCQGRRWTIPAVQVTTAATPGGVFSTASSPGTGEVLSIRELVTVPAGSFDTVHFKQIQNSPRGPIVMTTWRAIKEGVNVRWEYATAGGVSVEVLTAAR